jgi:predicted anti-sigma-YlaC factor YlaD
MVVLQFVYGRSARNLLLPVLFLCLFSCSLKKKAVDTLASVLGESEYVYLSDDDPELIAAAMPFNLKTLETLLRSNPDHRGLLLMTCKSFTFYTYGFVEPQAERQEDDDYYQAQETRRRAARLYMRAYRYGLRGLDVSHPGFAQTLPIDPEETVSRLKIEDVPLTVWTAAALGAAIAASTEDAESTADIAVVGTLLRKALELDSNFEEGTIQEFLISYETQAVDGSLDRARAYYEKALSLSNGKRCGIFLTWAESVSVEEQNQQEFRELLSRVLDFDVDSAPENRLLNILAQRRAEWLLTRTEDLFLDEGGVN